MAFLDNLGKVRLPRKPSGFGMIFYTQIQKNCADAIKSSKYYQKRPLFLSAIKNLFPETRNFQTQWWLVFFYVLIKRCSKINTKNYQNKLPLQTMLFSKRQWFTISADISNLFGFEPILFCWLALWWWNPNFFWNPNLVFLISLHILPMFCS